MSWPTFVYLYSGAMLACALLLRRVFRQKHKALLRTLVLGALLLLLADALAEQRGLWLIPRPSGVFVLASPAENVLVVVSAILNSLLPYLYLRRRSR